MGGGMVVSMATLQQPVPTSPINMIGDDELYEVVDGQRVRKPMNVLSVYTGFQLAHHLANFADGNLGRVLTEALFYLPAPINRSRRPDVSFVSYRRWAKDRPIPP